MTCKCHLLLDLFMTFYINRLGSDCILVKAAKIACEFLSGFAVRPVHQFSVCLLATACHLELSGPIAEFWLRRILDLLPGCQRNEAHLCRTSALF